jgi:hypothetical protein
MSDKKNEFIIRFDGVHLSKEASQRIQNGINDLLLQELAGQATFKADDDDNDYCGIYIPHRWIGRQIMPVDLNKNLEVVRNDARLAFVAQAQNLAH